MIDLLEGLNDRQKEAVETTEGYVRVVAGAGSGKTKALTHRYAYLVEMAGVSTENILCVTFTNKAAGEMRARIRNIIGDHDTGYICTFHGFCVKELREDIHLLNYPKNFLVMDEEDQNKILHSIYEEKDIDARKTTFSYARNMVCARKEKLDYIDLMKQPDNKKLIRAYKEAKKVEDIIFYGYLVEQKKNFSLDYDDLINYTFYILSTHNQERDFWQRRMQYVMVDEFQDVSHRQYALAELLSGYHHNLFIVGDPDQTIYTWRGADVNIFLDFDISHPDTNTIVMDTNYRSNSPIIMGSNSLIANNRMRFEKKLVPVKQTGDNILYYHGKNVKDEADWIAEQMISLNRGGVSYADIAILYRAHHVSRPIEESLLEKKIPYIIYSGVEFYGRKEIKDILAYLRMIVQPNDLDFLRTINEPRRNFGKKRVDLITEFAKEHECSLWEALKKCIGEDLIANSKAGEYITLIEKYSKLYRKMKITDLLTNVLEETGYEMALKVAGEDERLENLAELKQAIYDYEVNSNESTSIEEYLQSIALFTNMDKEQRKHSVKLMTIHASKGLEFPYVFVCGLSEGIFPSGRVSEYDDMEEERRLAYVAYTRAEEKLYLSDAEGVTFEGENRIPSRFIFNIDENFISYVNPIDDDKKTMFLSRIEGSERVMEIKKSPTITEGTRIRHKVFGDGTVIKLDFENNCYEILFDRMGTSRNIMMKMELEIIK